MRACSLLSTITPPLRWRLAFFVFARRMWRIPARLRLIFPEPVTLKRFLAPEWVFIFGMAKMCFFEKWSAKVRCPSLNVVNVINFFRAARRRACPGKIDHIEQAGPYFLGDFLGAMITIMRRPSIRGSCSGAPKSSSSFKKRSSNNSPRSLNTMARPRNWT